MRTANGKLLAVLGSFTRERPALSLSDLARAAEVPLSTALGLLVREALTNVERHSSARRAEVHAFVSGSSLVLSVVDDGVGGADPGTGTGLQGLADRAAVVGGRMTVTSPRGGPTELRMELPWRPISG